MVIVVFKSLKKTPGSLYKKLKSTWNGVDMDRLFQLFLENTKIKVLGKGIKDKDLQKSLHGKYWIFYLQA